MLKWLKVPYYYSVVVQLTCPKDVVHCKILIICLYLNRYVNIQLVFNVFVRFRRHYDRLYLLRNQERQVTKIDNEQKKIERFHLGPVFVEFPIDVLYPFHLVEREVGIKPNAKTLADKLANLF